MPSFQQSAEVQMANERAFMEASHSNFEDFHNRNVAAGFPEKLANIAAQLDQVMKDLDTNAHANMAAGTYARRTTGATKLWSAGMTASKTAAVNAKLQTVAKEAMLYYNDPVYGPFFEQHFTVLMNEVEAALMKYQTAMENKYNSDPVFRAKADAYVASEMALGNELKPTISVTKVG